MLKWLPKIEAVANFVRSRWDHRPRAGVVLGSGLGNFASQVTDPVTIPYAEIPHFPQSTVVGHQGQLVCGSMESVPVITMQGRFHLYEGYSAAAATLPIRVMKQLGIDLLVVSNAGGGLNPQYQTGDILVIDDHINLMFNNPLFGVNDDRLGDRFPDMSRPYDPQLIQRALEIARQNNFVAHRGVYAAVLGPTYETRAEYRMLRHLGADVVGMSTVPEVIVAVHAKLRVLAFSAVTNVCQPDRLDTTDAQQVVEAAAGAEPKMTTMVRQILAGKHP